jgi:ribulose-phosphate 3-epimerase
MKISASVFAQNHTPIDSLVSHLERIGVSMLHIDCFSGEDLDTFFQKGGDSVRLPLDVHLISEHPEQFLDKTEGHHISRLCLQYEKLKEIPPTFFERNFSKGLAIETNTAINSIDNSVFEKLDFLMLMCTQPGLSGGKFDIKNFQRINYLKNHYPKLKITIDGGVNSEIAFILKLLGVDTVVSGSFLLDKMEYGVNMLHLLHPVATENIIVRDFMLPLEFLPILNEGKFSVKDAMQIIDDYKTGFGLIVNADGALAGVTTNADIRRAILKQYDNFKDIVADSIVNRNPVKINENVSVKKMLETIDALGMVILFLPVTDDNGKLKGLVPLNNLARG